MAASFTNSDDITLLLACKQIYEILHSKNLGLTPRKTINKIIINIQIVDNDLEKTLIFRSKCKESIKTNLSVLLLEKCGLK